MCDDFPEFGDEIDPGSWADEQKQIDDVSKDFQKDDHWTDIDEDALA